MLTVEVKVGLKKGVSDPEGGNTHKSLELLGYGMELGTDDREAARKRVEEMCRRILTNPVIHTYEITFL